MYNIEDYLQRGLLFANNMLFPSRKKMSTLMLYATSLCDSRCKHCMVWNKRPVVHMPKEKIFRIMASKCISKNTSVGLEGGEFLLHPESMEILKWFRENHPNFDLLSNCLKPDKLINAVRTYPPRRLYLSLDGNKETYRYMRGRDGYDLVIKVIEECKDIAPISLMFTLSPYNRFSDAEYVVELAKKYDIDVRIGIYNNIDFFDTQDKAHQENNAAFGETVSDFKKQIPANVADTSENIDFLYLYDEWKNGRLKLRCNSIFDSLVIHPNGDVPICQNLDLKLGNVYDKSLDEIFNSRKTREIQKEYAHNCNKCWINFHRKYDIVLLRTLETFFPKRLIEIFYGKYQWTSDRR
ncbi:MAG: SPASM domain-containing protein, partial [Candidatus Symbiothrix sp.]|nr:SPASM domain-containing protein [Candidatus Symbiothrix sp.]